jgi:uncharacterized membrane protein YdjX (TVP38/TMEM64 family)
MRPGFYKHLYKTAVVYKTYGSFFNESIYKFNFLRYTIIMKPYKVISGTKVIQMLMRAAPLVMVGVCLVFYLTHFAKLSPAELIDRVTRYRPPNLFVGAAVIIAMYGMKSLSLIFPMVVLVVASGIIFDNIAVALAVNLCGVVLQITLPFLIGRFAERGFVTRLLEKHKNLRKAQEFNAKNELFVCYFLRVINILPCDVVSMYFGATGTTPKNYYIGSMLGILPGMVVATVAGSAITEPTSPQFIASIAVEVTFAVGSAIFYFFYKHKTEARIQNTEARIQNTDKQEGSR